MRWSFIEALSLRTLINLIDWINISRSAERKYQSLDLENLTGNAVTRYTNKLDFHSTNSLLTYTKLNAVYTTFTCLYAVGSLANYRFYDVQLVFKMSIHFRTEQRQTLFKGHVNQMPAESDCFYLNKTIECKASCLPHYF